MTSIEQVKQKYHALSFNSLSSSLETLLTQAEANELSHLQFADLMVSHELGRREENRVQLNLKRAGFPVHKQLEEFDFMYQTTITKKQVIRLLDFTFLDNRENLVFMGPPGVGKTHLAIAIGIKTVHAGYKVLFSTALNLIESLDLAEMKGQLKKKINALAKYDLLVVDELGFLPMNKKSVYTFFQLINTLYEYRSLILTTNKDFTNWSEFFFDDTVAVPIVDRVIHHSHIFRLGGESYRLKEKIAARQPLI